MRLLVTMLLGGVILVGALMAYTAGKQSPVAQAPNGIELPEGYHDWRIVASSCRSDNGTLRVILGNDIAVQAVDSAWMNPWPDGAILCKLVWKQDSLKAWPAAIVPGDFVQVEFMLKDSKAYGSTGGWGFARWLGLDQKPYGADETFVRECFGCHQPVARNDYVFTRPAKMP